MLITFRTDSAGFWRYVRAAQQTLEPEDSDATSDSQLQSSDSEDPDDSNNDKSGQLWDV